jgi:hypothetical protein
LKQPILIDECYHCTAHHICEPIIFAGNDNFNQPMEAAPADTLGYAELREVRSDRVLAMEARASPANFPAS